MKTCIISILLFLLINFHIGCHKKQSLETPVSIKQDIKIQKEKLPAEDTKEKKTGKYLSPAPRQKQSFYIVGTWETNRDCLYNISRKVYNNPDLWVSIFFNNLKQIKNPNLIYPGQVLLIPNLSKSWETNLFCPACRQGNLRKKYLSNSRWEYSCPACGYMETTTK